MKTANKRWFAPLFSMLALGVGAMQVAHGQEAIVVHNLYYPKAGLEQEVLRTRLEASSVRQALGLAVGRVLIRVDGASNQPYVIWECEYPSLEARQKDAAAAEGDPAFKEVQKKMRTLTERFERIVWKTAVSAKN